MNHDLSASNLDIDTRLRKPYNDCILRALNPGGPLIYFIFMKDKGLWAEWKHPHERPEKYIEARNKVLAEVRQYTDGMNISKCYDFVRSLGLSTTDCVVVRKNSESYLKLIEIFNSVGFLSSFKNPDSTDSTGETKLHVNGFFNTQLNLIVIFRDEDDADSLQRTLRSEADLVHELVHGSSEYKEFYGHENLPINQRVGFIISKSSVEPLESPGYEGKFKVNIERLGGSFLEEGTAEMFAVEYLEANLPNSERIKRWKARGLDQSMEIGSDQYNEKLQKITLLNSNNGVEYILSIPIKYCFFDFDGQVGFNPHRFFQAYALELLCARLPELRGALIKSRDDVNGVREVIKLLNSLDSNLYVDLRELSENVADSVEGFFRITKLVGGSILAEKK